MENNSSVAKNIKVLRKANGFTQERLAEYLNVGRSAYANYESFEREAPLDVLERLADLFGCDLYELYEDDQDAQENMLATAFRVDDLSLEDMNQVAAFKRMVKNYLKMDSMLAR